MKRLWLAILLLGFAPRVHAQGTQVASYPSDPPTCNSARGIIEYNTTTQQLKVCGPSANSWSLLGGGGGAGIGGTAAANRVAFGSGSNTITSDPTFIYTPASGPLSQNLSLTCNPNTVNEDCGNISNVGTVTGSVGDNYAMQNNNIVTVNTPNSSADRFFGLEASATGQGSGNFTGAFTLSLIGAEFNASNTGTGTALSAIGTLSSAGNSNAGGSATTTSAYRALTNTNAHPAGTTNNYGFQSDDQSNQGVTNYDFFAPATTAGTGTNWQYFAATGGTSSFDAVNTGPNLFVSTCSPVPVDLGATACLVGNTSGTVTGPLTGNGTVGVAGVSTITINSPNTSSADYIGVHGSVNTSGTGSLTSTDGMWSFWASNSNNGNSWINSTSFEGGGLSIFGAGTVNNAYAFESSDLSDKASAFAFDFHAEAGRAASGGLVTAVQYGAAEGVAPVGLANQDELYANSTTHRWSMNNNNGGALSVVGITTAGTSGHLTQLAANGIDVVDSGVSSTAIPINNIGSATGTQTISNGNNPQTWQWAQTTNNQAGLSLNESAASTNGTVTNLVPNQAMMKITTAAGSTSGGLVLSGNNTSSTNIPLIAATATLNNGALSTAPYVFRSIETSTGAGNLFEVLGGAAGNTPVFTVGNSAGGAIMSFANAYNFVNAGGFLSLENSSDTQFYGPWKATGFAATDTNAFGSIMNFKSVACETNFAPTAVNTGSATTTTGLACLPANAIIYAVLYRITTAITTAASFTVGDGTTAARFCATQNTLTLGTTGSCFVPWTSATAGTMGQVAAANVVVTFNATPGAGAIRLIVYGLIMTPPTS